MRDKITVEDFTTDQACGTPPSKRKPPHHLPHHMPPSSLARIPNFHPESAQSELKIGEEMSVVIEDFTGVETSRPHPSLSQSSPSPNENLKCQARGSAGYLDKNSDYEISNHTKSENHYENYASVPSIKSLTPSEVETHDDRVLNRGIEGEEGRFNIARNFEHVLSPTRHLQSNDCEIVNKTYNMTIFYNYSDSDDGSRCNFVDNSRDPILVNEKNVFTIGDDFVLADSKSSFNLSPDVNFSISSNKYNLNSELSHDKKSLKFDLHDGLNWRTPKRIKLVGQTDCSLDRNRPKFSIPEVNSTDLRHRSKFQIPLYETPSGKRKTPKFSIPDYDSYKNNRRKHPKFHLYHDIKVFKDRLRHSIPNNFKTGWGFKRFSVPIVKDGMRKTCTKVEIPKDFTYKPGTSRFNVPLPINQDQPKEDTYLLKGSKFHISQPVKVYDKTKNVSIAPDFDLELGRIEFEDLTENYELINETRNFEMSPDFVLKNVNLTHEFNELLIDCSQLSL